MNETETHHCPSQSFPHPLGTSTTWAHGPSFLGERRAVCARGMGTGGEAGDRRKACGPEDQPSWQQRPAWHPPKPLPAPIPETLPRPTPTRLTWP